MGVARCRAELGMPQKHLDHPTSVSRLQQMRRKAVAQRVQRGGLLIPAICLADVKARFNWRGDKD